jgi:hypothetical protein
VRRAAVLLAALGLGALAGCSSSSETGIGQYYQILRQSLRENRITAEQAGAIPYASLGLKVDGNPEMLLVLATETNGNLMWTSRNHVVVVTRDGRIVRTVGLPHDVENVSPAAGQERPPSAALVQRFITKRSADYPDVGRYAVALNCSTAAMQRETITILGSAIPTIRVQEHCSDSESRWSFTDTFWVDSQNGFIWRSIQHTHPEGTKISIEIFRPPA